MKSLSIKGFKSFADTTKLTFAPGVMVVVGPNGSGKSNVVDAISWVLGTQAPNAIRSAKMNDVIFAGSKGRSSLGRAEVALTINNESGLLPVDFPEVVISRTLFRAGDSEYHLNGAPCRLLDIADLLSHGGVGRHQHIIVGQGQVDSILNSNPEERRMIIEEAAGVLKYRKRREKAERRLESTDGDMSRVGDLMRELRRQLEPLERQAEAANKHSELLKHLNELRIYIAGQELLELKEKKTFTNNRVVELQDSKSRLTANLSELDAQIQKAEEKITNVGEADSGETLAALEILKEKARSHADFLRAKAAALDSDVPDSDEMERLKREEAECVLSLEALDKNIEDLKSRQEAVKENLDSLDSRKHDAAAIKGEIMAVEESMKKSLQQEASLQADIQRLRSESEEVSSEKSKAAELLGKAEKERMHWISRLEALAMTKGFSSKETSHRMDKAIGVLGDLISVSPGYELAVEAALGETAGAVVLPDELTALSAVRELLENNDSARVISIPGETPSGDSGENAPNAQGSMLRSFVEPKEPALEPLLDLLLGSVRVAEDWEEAIQVSKDTGLLTVTKKGDSFGAGGWKLGVRRTVADTALAETSLLAAEADISAKIAENEIHLTSLRGRFEEMETREREALIAADVSRKQMETERERLKQNESRKAELHALSHEMVSEEEVSKLKAEQNSNSTRLEELQKEHRDLDVKKASLTEAQKLLGQKVSQIPDQEVIAMRKIIADLITWTEGKVGLAEAGLKSIRESRQKLMNESRQASTELESRRGKRFETEREISAVQEELSRLEVAEAEISVHLENAGENLRRDLATEPRDALVAACPEIPGHASPRERVEEIEKELRLLGPINPLALREYEGLKERHSLISTQLEDIRTARKELRKLIRNIDVEIANAFESAFADVSVNFENLFQITFPGGSGRLVLSDPGNLLETGVEIEARPKEKKVKRLSLLSGGERSLVALTFLFAVLTSRPVPFCIMDEVDAALDDINLCRFVDMLNSLSPDTQLIVVTHQKRTMEAADCLYGISMPSDGVTRVISERAVSNS